MSGKQNGFGFSSPPRRFCSDLFEHRCAPGTCDTPAQFFQRADQPDRHKDAAARGREVNQIGKGFVIVGVLFDQLNGENKTQLRRRQFPDRLIDHLSNSLQFGPDLSRQWRHSVGVDRSEQRVIDQMIINQLGAGQARQVAANRVFAGAGESKQHDDRVLQGRQFYSPFRGFLPRGLTGGLGGVVGVGSAVGAGGGAGMSALANRGSKSSRIAS